ncbi:MAG TPA: ATP-binding protein [Burkholderiales bacterium]|nr:ATP-binding protein [Burkholderiales bacterium]
MRLTNFYYPKSVLKLLLIGFVVVSLPLVIALINATISVQRLANQSELAVDHAVQAARAPRLLMEQTLSMERVVRQYMIVNAPDQLEDYDLLRKAFARAIADLGALPLEPPQREQLQRVSAEEARLYEQLKQPRTPTESRSLVDGYVALSALTRNMVNESNQIIENEIEAMRVSAEASQKSLMLQLVAAFPLGLITAAIFAFLIARPIAQLERGIRQLGNNELDQRIELHGPADLEYLGERLEWLRHRLIEIEEQKAMFLRHISHELKTPLTVLREGAELLADGSTGTVTPQQKDVIELMQTNSALLQQMIEDLLNYQRALASMARLDISDVDLTQVAASVIDAHRLSASRRGIALQLQARTAPLQADADKLRVVVDNLISNAIKFSPDHGKVWIGVAPIGTEVQLDVVDEGPGVPQADRNKVFEWFFQGERVQAGRVKGSGLGLAIARELVLAHKGRIDILDAQGAGAHFRVLLPKERKG